MRLLGKQASLVQLQGGGSSFEVRSRTSVQTSFISSSCPGQHRRLRPFRLLAAAAGFLCKKVAPGQHRREAPILFARVVQQKRHDVENVASAGASPAASTNLRSLSFGWASHFPGAEATADRHRTFNPVW